jgi:hypothetical protein
MPVVTSKKDPSNTARIRKQALAEYNQRLRRARIKIKELFKLIPRERIVQRVIPNVETVSLWNYDITEFELSRLETDIELIIRGELETATVDPPFGWWFAKYDEQAYRVGAVQENINIQQLVSGLIVLPFVLSDEQLLARPLIVDNIAKEVRASYTAISGMSDRTSNRVFQTIVNGINGNRSPREIREEINAAFDIASNDAKRIVDTEINRANNNARTATAQLYRDEFGIPTAVLHISALLSVTRASHAARHGNVYTPEQQNEWWSRDHNRINCKCSVRTVLLDSEGRVIETALQERLIKQRPFFSG